MFLVFNSVIELCHETSQMFCFDISVKNSFVDFSGGHSACRIVGRSVVEREEKSVRWYKSSLS